MTGYFAVIIYILASLVLFSYGMNCYVMIWLYLKSFKRGEQRNSKVTAKYQGWLENREVPKVTTQIPIYNEMNVTERAVRAAVAIEYPKDKYEIQIIDDSTDETSQLVDQLVDKYRTQGHDIKVIRRSNRIGYKAGALEHASKSAKGEYFAIFDSDFIPEPDFLKRIIPFFLDRPELGLVQAKWGHLNDKDSVFTYTQSLGIDGHFLIEQSARSFNGIYMNFNGTAGVWKKEAIEDAGGWEHDTLTEDLDLSYRAQLAGWKAAFVSDVIVPAELPQDVAAFKSQQFRWAKGSIQTAIKLFPRILKSDVSTFQKIEAFFHLTHYAIHPFMLLLALLGYPLILLGSTSVDPYLFSVIGMLMGMTTFAPSLLYWISQGRTGVIWWKRLIGIPLVMSMGVGIALTNTRAVFEALLGKQSAFIRTPKRGDKQLKSYSVKAPVIAFLEILLSIYCWSAFAHFLGKEQWQVAPFLVIYGTAFGYIGLMGMIQNVSGFKFTKLPKEASSDATA